MLFVFKWREKRKREDGGLGLSERVVLFRPMLVTASL